MFNQHHVAYLLDFSFDASFGEIKLSVENNGRAKIEKVNTQSQAPKKRLNKV